MKRSARPIQGLFAVAALLSAALAFGQTVKPAPSNGKVTERSKASLSSVPRGSNLKPTGAVTVTAKTAELVQGSSAVYTGNVVLTSNTLKLDGDRVEIKQYPGGQYEAKVTGGPAHMNHSGTGVDNPTVVARANTLNYDSRTGQLDLVGDAYVMRGEDELTGETILYDVNEHRVKAAGGGNNGQVTVIIQQADPAPETPTATPSNSAPTAPPAEKKP